MIRKGEGFWTSFIMVNYWMFVVVFAIVGLIAGASWLIGNVPWQMLLAVTFWFGIAYALTEASRRAAND